MAQPSIAVAAAMPVPQVNGASSSSLPGSPQSSSSATKRKRDVSDDGSHDHNVTDHGKPSLNGVPIGTRDDKGLIRDYFEVLRSYDVDSPILQRPLPDENSLDDEPQAKRQKSEEDATTSKTITDKVMQDSYFRLLDLVVDIKQAVTEEVSELQAGKTDDSPRRRNEKIAMATRFKDKALELFQRETNYPRGRPEPSQIIKSDPEDAAIPESASDNQILTVWGMGVKAMPLFSSLPHHESPASKPVNEASLPNGVTLTRIVPTPPGTERANRPSTLGELFPSPRNLPPLQPPKAAKPTTKGNILTFYHPELAEKSKYRVNTYFSQTISTGHYLDYSNATPTSQIKTKQRERAQSLAGRKPTTTELEISEMDALFRRVFSSFAPSKDDSAAMVSSGQIGRMWWQRYGRSNFERMVETEISEDEKEAENVAEPPLKGEVDEKQVQHILDNWEDRFIDPSLDEAMGKKLDDDKVLDDTLQEISDLIETLASYQRNRNLALPTSQDRQSMDPINGDMLRNGSSAHQISDEEMETYKVLKARLAQIIEDLPPYAVARINSDRLAELNVSTKVEVRMDEYKVVAEEDDAARVRSQHQAAMQAAVSSAARPSHRTPSIPSVPYGNQYSTGHYTPVTRAPMPSPQAYPQTPVRPPPPIYQQRPSPQVPVPQPPQALPRPPISSQQHYRPTNGYGSYAPQLAKSQTPFGHTNLAQYAGVSAQHRLPGYSSLVQANSPGQRLPTVYPTGYPQTQTPYAQSHQPSQRPGYSPYANGTPPMPPRTISPQVSGQPHQYGQSPNHPQQMSRPPYGSPNPSAMEGDQERRVMEQAKARAFAQESSQRFGDKISQGGIAGLAGIGLGGNVDMAKLAAARANRAAMSPGLNSPAGMGQLAHGQGGGNPVPSPINGIMPSPSPVPVAASMPPPPVAAAGGSQAPPPS